MSDNFRFEHAYAQSESEKERERWHELFDAGWPNFESMIWTPGSARQKHGRDCVLRMSGKDHEVERKMIRHPKWFNNFLIEVAHTATEEFANPKPGWIEYLTCDFLAWGWWEHRCGIVLSMPKLRAIYKERWSERKPRINTQPTEFRNGEKRWTWNIPIGLGPLKWHVGFWELGEKPEGWSTKYRPKGWKEPTRVLETELPETTSDDFDGLLRF